MVIRRFSYNYSECQGHGLTDFFKRVPRHFTCLFTTVVNYSTDQLWILNKFDRMFTNRRLFLQNRIDNRLLAIETANPGISTAVNDPVTHVFSGIDLMEIPDRALLWIAGITAPDAGRIGLHCA